LPPGRLRDLVGVAAHPHNQPRLDPSGRSVVSGYGILQPRVATPLPAPKDFTLYHWLFAGQCGIDPYSAASSEIYQDVFAEGTFTGMTGKEVAVYIAANPSHLEAVNGVLEGIVRAKQDRTADGTYGVLPLLVHGDASMAGQGIVMEQLQMSQLRAYKTGGTVHVVINNQVGFTTPPTEARSSVYSSDVALTIQAPIFHVNGDDPEAVTFAAKVATEYRQLFGKDVVVDMFCYRLCRKVDFFYSQVVSADNIEQNAFRAVNGYLQQRG